MWRGCYNGCLKAKQMFTFFTLSSHASLQIPMIYEITPSFHAPILPGALHTLKPTNAIEVQLTNVIKK